MLTSFFLFINLHSIVNNTLFLENLNLMPKVSIYISKLSYFFRIIVPDNSDFLYKSPTLR
ncbi:TPA_asm: hypothetical protein GHN96_03075 [Listeria monocytogenes]|uniref:Uncharacterized protein n=2 Tax=Listeria monocytogenes TaxID=1639 RepID=A0A460GLA4_LISMN|nr:hypothetical protein B0X19_03060 [Listeria monocytogenes]EAE3729648.1 hypothetical protein [Listeria monocytogenes serotype 1/2a]EAG6289514.1 hypothetical protein [Listeria monocytogenes CFSAN003825]EAG6316768.1 hypothetical protein [Listeria monocytogenes CFSAN003824]EAG6341976.1 hypothetical protein [Listeria monocytogenes CFSAN003811]EEW14097.1 conserved hypothetical protein [Listeria monocytogenes FSL N3-165]EEW20749.1 conserved hypothetical protein [Listeria monocytogenes F6900]EFF97